MTIVGLFASIGEHIPILKKEKLGEPDPEGHIKAAHYRGTTLLILGCCLLVTCTEWVSGTDSIIDCVHEGAIPENVINTYCYIMGTFSVPRHYVDYDTQIGAHVANTGVGPYHPGEEIEIKKYYQWVPFMLFLQGIMFYVPHIFYKYFEKGKIESILEGLHRWILSNEERQSKEKELAEYIVGTKGTHRSWCLKLLFASGLYVVNVVGQIFFTDCFLGYEFSTYGVNAASFLEAKPEDRIDPMSRIFPRMTKCTFKKYGPSGSIQNHDAQCILPINIINEKIYVFLWFWFCFLTFITILGFLWEFLLIFTLRARKQIIIRKLRLSPKRNRLNVDVNLITECLDFGDWKLVYHLLRNMNSETFAEFCEHLTEKLRGELNPTDSCMKLNDVIGDNSSNLNASVPSDDKANYITMDDLNDGNYLRSSSPKESQI